MKFNENVAKEYLDIQAFICDEIEKVDKSSVFNREVWQSELGEGRTCTFSGSIIEKAAVNFSKVKGELSTGAAKALGVNPDSFFATGISIVMHPKNPWSPIIHMNVRYFELGSGGYWFGGGIDLTPHYVIDEYASKFHKALFDLCETYQTGFYEKTKNEADDYFFLTHRGETRGIGGIFFDRIGPDNEQEKLALFEFTKKLARAFPSIYAEQLEALSGKEYSEKNLEWQNLRRGRYVEFNLVFDRGTKFGLETGGRTESILVSMPPVATWVYQHDVDKGSLEYETLSKLKKGVNWL